MNIDITQFNVSNIIDSCSIWNILSSETLYSKTISKGCVFGFTKFVEYECLYKKRRNDKDSDTLRADSKIKDKFKEEINKKHFTCYNISIEDLQSSELLNYRKRIGYGELSSIAFAKKTSQYFMTDDQTARKLANKVLEEKKTQTTPHLLGWLYYKNVINDTDINTIIREHKSNKRPLEPYFKEVHKEACRIKLMNYNLH